MSWSRSLRLSPVLLLALVAAPARAGEIPVSALSDATAVPPELLDGPGVMALHPQTSVLLPSQGGALASTRFSRTVLGVARTERHAAFVFAQPSAITTDGTLDVIQGGWALRLGALRVGAAIRGGRSRVYDDRLSDDGRSQFVSESLLRLRETSVGIGFGNGATRIDLAFEVTARDTEESRLDRRGSAIDLASALGEGASRYGAWMRLTVPVAERRTFRVVGGYTDESIDVERELAVSSPPTTITETNETKGHRWEAMLALRQVADEGDWTVWGGYENRRGGLGLDASSFTLRESVRESDRVSGGVAVRRRVWWNLDLHGGLSADYRSEEFERRDRSVSSTGYDNDATEATSQTFAWGLARDFDGWRVGGALSTNLSLSDPLASVDASFLF